MGGNRLFESEKLAKVCFAEVRMNSHIRSFNWVSREEKTLSLIGLFRFSLVFGASQGGNL